MKRIEVLGPGCQKCEALYERTREAARELGLECTIEKVTDIEAIIRRGVLSTPALVLDDEIKAAGRVPSTGEIRRLLS
ncbi:MAG: thioredoxin family protein [bacterium]